MRALLPDSTIHTLPLEAPPGNSRGWRVGISVAEFARLAQRKVFDRRAAFEQCNDLTPGLARLFSVFGWDAIRASLWKYLNCRSGFPRSKLIRDIQHQGGAAA
jgi:hypothetical protein